MSKVEVDKVIPQSGTTLTIGDSGDTINVVGTLQNNGGSLAGVTFKEGGTNFTNSLLVGTDSTGTLEFCRWKYWGWNRSIWCINYWR